MHNGAIHQHPSHPSHSHLTKGLESLLSPVQWREQAGNARDGVGKDLMPHPSTMERQKCLREHVVVDLGSSHAYDLCFHPSFFVLLRIEPRTFMHATQPTVLQPQPSLYFLF